VEMTTISLNWKTKVMLKELKLEMEKHLQRDISWDFFFSEVKKIVDNNGITELIKNGKKK